MRNVLEEDAMLLLWREVLHGCVCCVEGKEVRQGEVGAVHVRIGVFSRRTFLCKKERRELKKDSMYE